MHPHLLNQPEMQTFTTELGQDSAIMSGIILQHNKAIYKMTT